MSSRMSGFMDMIFKGKDTVRISELDSRMQRMASFMMQRAGIKGDTLSRKQIEEAMRNRGSGGSSDEKDYSRQADFYFRRSDKNGDGVLNYEEMSDTLKREKDKYDENKDGIVSKEEYGEYITAYFKARESQNDGGRERDDDEEKNSEEKPEEDPISELDRRPKVYRAGEYPDELPFWFAELDTNSDAQVALYEWKAGQRGIGDFRPYDRNDDAFITVEELLLHMEEHPEEKRSSSDRSGFGGRSSRSSSGDRSSRSSRGR